MLDWLPRWLGLSFSTIYTRFGEDIYTFDDAKEVLHVSDQKALLTLSLLRRKGVMSVFGRRGRKRLYRLCDPRALMVSLGLGVSLSLKQERYRNLILKLLYSLYHRFREELTSVVIFGSVARGTATNQSDLDVVVVGGFSSPFAQRIDELYELEYGGIVGEEIRWLRQHDVFCHVSWFPLTSKEAMKARPLYFDLVDDALIIYDRDSFFSDVLNALRAKMLAIGSKRIWIDESRWFWIIKPSIGVEEALSLEEVCSGVH